MSETELTAQIEALKNKLNRAEKRLAGLKEKSKHLEMQYDDAREREANSHDLVMELIERQRELNVMLNRANIMLNRTQEAMALTSMEFNEMAKALPEPKKVEWADRVAKINDLFKKTGVQDAELLSLDSPNPEAAESLETDELKKAAEQQFSRKDAIWQRTEARRPPRVEAELVEEPSTTAAQSSPECAPSSTDSDDGTDEEPTDSQPRKPWWRLAG